MKYAKLFSFVVVMAMGVHTWADTDDLQILPDGAVAREVIIEEQKKSDVIIDVTDEEENNTIVETMDDEDNEIDDQDFETVKTEDLLFDQDEEQDIVEEDAERCPCSRPQQQVQTSNQQSIYGRPAQTYYPQQRPVYPSQQTTNQPIYRPRPTR